MSEHCAQCRALLPDESTCQKIHHELLLFEAQHPIPHSVHFLHITCFMIQHELYSDEALIWAQSLLRIHLNEDLTEQQKLAYLHPREKNGASRARTWKFGRSAHALPLSEVAWVLTIVDIARHARDAEEYSAWIKQWARLTLQQMTSAYALDWEA